MTLTDERMSVKLAVLKELQQFGWQLPDRLGLMHTSIVSFKEYDSAVGKKMAFIYMNQDDLDQNVCHLSSVYESEGRNALITTTLTAHNEVIHKKVPRFVSAIDTVVSQTYAVGLLLKYGPSIARQL